MEALESNLKVKFPFLTSKQIKEKKLDFVRILAKEGLKNHLSVSEKGIDGLNRQYLIVIHGEKEHLHAHIVANTIDYNNKVFSKTKEDLHNQEWCKKIKAKYSFLADLDYKTVADYEYTDKEKQTLEMKIFKEKQEKKELFFKECKRIGLSSIDVINDINASMNEIIKKDEIKPEHFVKLFSSLNKPYQIQPVFHIKKSKVAGISYKIHFEGREITLKSSLLDEQMSFKSIKDRLIDYRYNRQQFDAVNSWIDFNNQFYSLDKVEIISDSLSTFRAENFKSRYLEWNGNGLQFKDGWGRLKDKTVITETDDIITILESNAITIKETVRLAKEKGWDKVIVRTESAELAKIYYEEAEKLGIQISFRNEDYNKKFCSPNLKKK